MFKNNMTGNNNRLHKNKSVDNETRHRIIDNYLSVESTKEIAEIFKNKPQRFETLLKFILLRAALKKDERGYRRLIFNSECLDYIKQLIDSDISITLSSIKNKVLNKIDDINSLCIFTIQINIKGFLFFKKNFFVARRNK